MSQKTWTTEELSEMFDTIRVGFERIYSLFKYEMGVDLDDEDMEGLRTVLEYLEERI